MWTDIAHVAINRKIPMQVAQQIAVLNNDKFGICDGLISTWHVNEFIAECESYVNLGDVCRGRLNEQCQYGSRYASPACKEYIADNLRILGDRSDYHAMYIHQDDVEEFVRRVQAQRKSTQ